MKIESMRTRSYRSFKVDDADLPAEARERLSAIRRQRMPDRPMSTSVLGPERTRRRASISEAPWLETACVQRQPPKVRRPDVPRRAVPAHVGRSLQPAPRLLVQVLVADELAPVEEAFPHIADRTLHLALRGPSCRPGTGGTRAPGTPSAGRSAGTPRSPPAPLRRGGRPTPPPSASGRTAARPAPRRSARTHPPGQRTARPSSGAGRTAATAAASSPAPPAARGAGPTAA